MSEISHQHNLDRRRGGGEKCVTFVGEMSKLTDFRNLCMSPYLQDNAKGRGLTRAILSRCPQPAALQSSERVFIQDELHESCCQVLLDGHRVMCDLSNRTRWVEPSEYQMAELGFHHPNGDGLASDA